MGFIDTPRMNKISHSHDISGRKCIQYVVDIGRGTILDLLVATVEDVSMHGPERLTFQVLSLEDTPKPGT